MSAAAEAPTNNGEGSSDTAALTSELTKRPAVTSVPIIGVLDPPTQAAAATAYQFP